MAAATAAGMLQLHPFHRPLRHPAHHGQGAPWGRGGANPGRGLELRGPGDLPEEGSGRGERGERWGGGEEGQEE